MMATKDLERFTKYFLIKGVQIIVESRLGNGKTKRSNCNAKGNDWFDLAHGEIKDVNDQIFKCLDEIYSSDRYSSNDGTKEQDQLPKSPVIAHKPDAILTKKNWRVCCEISLKNMEGNLMTLECWFFTNDSIDANETNKPGPSLAIYNIYNRMSLMLKSIITCTRATPASKISLKGADTYVICYRVYQCELCLETMFQKGTFTDDQEFFTQEIKLGSIKTPVNVLSVSFIYRTNMTTMKSKSSPPKSPQLLPVKIDHFTTDNCANIRDDRQLNTPLAAAFASSPTNETNYSIPLPAETPFAELLHLEMETQENNKNDCKVPKISEPISIPETLIKTGLKFPPSTLFSSSADSFVFVELNPPFASDQQQELGSFFNGPSPNFKADLPENISEISNQLALLESNFNQWDDFVESVCSLKNEEEGEGV